MRDDWKRAVESGDVSATRALARDGADLDSLDRHGQTGLMIAAHRGHAGVVELLAKLGANLDHTAKYRLSALMLATIGGHAEVVRVLVEAGADTRCIGGGDGAFAGKTALEIAVDLERDDIAALLGDGNA